MGPKPTERGRKKVNMQELLERRGHLLISRSLSEADADAVVEGFLGKPSGVSLLHHRYELVVVYASILQEHKSNV